MAKKASLISRGLGHLYHQEFRNRPSDPEELSFKDEDFCYWDGEIKLDESGQPWVHITWMYANGDGERFEHPLVKPVNTYCGVDLNAKDHGDFGWLQPIGIDPDENVFCEDYIRRRMDSHYVIEELFKLDLLYNFELVTIETVAYQEQLKREFLRLQNVRGTYIPVRGEPKRAKKSLCHEELIPIHRRHKLWIKKHHTVLENEMRGYPKPPTDDGLDGLWLAYRWADVPEGRRAVEVVGGGWEAKAKAAYIHQQVMRNPKLW